MEDRFAIRRTSSRGSSRGPSVALLLVMALAACTSIGPFEPENGGGTPGEITIALPEPVVFAVGARQSLGILLPDGLEPGDFSDARWTSSAPQVATVSSDGVVTTVGDGTTTITVEWRGTVASATLTVEASFLFSARISTRDQGDPDLQNDRASVRVTVIAGP